MSSHIATLEGEPHHPNMGAQCFADVQQGQFLHRLDESFLWNGQHEMKQKFQHYLKRMDSPDNRTVRV